MCPRKPRRIGTGGVPHVIFQSTHTDSYAGGLLIDCTYRLIAHSGGPGPPAARHDSTGQRPERQQQPGSGSETEPNRTSHEPSWLSIESDQTGLDRAPDWVESMSHDACPEPGARSRRRWRGRRRRRLRGCPGPARERIYFNADTSLPAALPAFGMSNGKARGRNLSLGGRGAAPAQPRRGGRPTDYDNLAVSGAACRTVKQAHGRQPALGFQPVPAVFRSALRDLTQGAVAEASSQGEAH